MSSSKPLVIVLSRNYSTGLGVIRSLGYAGYTVDLIASVKKSGSSVIASRSRFVRNCVEVLSKKIQGDDGRGILDEIMKYASTDEQKVLFPADDFTASIVAQNYDLLKPHFLMPKLIGDKSMLEAMNKKYQTELAKSVGLDTLDEWIIDLRGDIDIPNDIKYPCFVKPAESVNGAKSEMVVCDSRDGLASHLSKMKSFYADREVVVQEFLEIEKEYDLSGVCLDDEIIIPAVIEKTRISKHERGVTVSGIMLRRDVLGDSMEKILAMLKALRYFGMFDMELFEANGKIYFNEINLRSGGPNYSYYLNGVNLPDIFVKELIGVGHSKSEENIKEYGKSFVYEKVAWEDYIHSHMTRQELRECISGADYTLLADKNDSAPGNCFMKRIRLSALKNKVLNALGK